MARWLVCLIVASSFAFADHDRTRLQVLVNLPAEGPVWGAFVHARGPVEGVPEEPPDVDPWTAPFLGEAYTDDRGWAAVSRPAWTHPVWYFVYVEADGFEPHAQWCWADRWGVPVQVDLPPRVARLRVRISDGSEDPFFRDSFMLGDVHLWLSGEGIEFYDLTADTFSSFLYTFPLQLKPGTYSVWAEREGFTPDSATIQVELGENEVHLWFYADGTLGFPVVYFTYVGPPYRDGVLRFLHGDEVVAERELIGTNRFPQGFPPGHYTLEVLLDGVSRYRNEVDVVPGQQRFVVNLGY